jgi:hypothetical protein
MLEKAGNRVEDFSLTPLKTPWESEREVEVTSCRGGDRGGDGFWIDDKGEFRANRFESRKTVGSTNIMQLQQTVAANTRD